MIDRQLTVGETVWWARRDRGGACAELVRIERWDAAGSFVVVSTCGATMYMNGYAAAPKHLFENQTDAERYAALRAMGAP